MAASYFDCYKFLLIPLWLYGWNPYKIKVCWQTTISTTCFVIQLTFYVACVIISFSQHYNAAGDAILVMFFMINLTICFIKHCGLFFCRKSFESVVDYFNKHLLPEEEELQTIIKNKTKPVLKLIYPFLGFTYFLDFLSVLVPTVQKYCFGIHENIVPIFQPNLVIRSFTFTVMCLSSTIYNTVFITFCNFIIAHIDVLIYQISHIKYERGFDKNELRKSLKKVMKRHASILMVNELRCNAFHWLVFLQLSVSTACICFALIHPEDTSTLIFLPYQFIEICIFCYFGQLVENKSEEISFAYYSTPWTEMEPTDRKLILVALHNSQKPLQTSGGPFTTLSHETLKNVLQSAYSYYAVLKEIQ